MINESAGFFSTFWLIFSFSFLVALTGAMAPGPLLTYTIIQSVRTDRRGYLMGVWVIIGHALLEMGIIVLLLLGFSFVLKNMMVVRIIGTIGGIILAWFGAGIIRYFFSELAPAAGIFRGTRGRRPGLVSDRFSAGIFRHSKSE